MTQLNQKGFINTIVAAVGIIILVGVAGYLVVSRQASPGSITEINSFEECAKTGYPVAESYPRQCSVPNGGTFAEELTIGTTGPTGFCAQDAKICPDGRAVGRIGPNCEFAPCGTGVNPSEPGTIQPYNPGQDKGGLYNYPNYPLTVIPATPISVKYLVEHRVALDQKTVTVRGVVVAVSVEPPCIAAGTCELLYRPSIALADTKDMNRNKDYDFTVLLGEGNEKEYSVGKTVEIKVLITASRTVVYGNKVY